MKDNCTVQVIERAADILAQFTIGEPVLGISEISRRTALNKGTVYRILLTLEDLGYVRRDNAANKYRLGLELFRLGSLVQAGMDFRREALPIMRVLYDACGETVNLNVAHEKQRVCVECIESAKAVRIFAQVGMTAPLTRGASGKVLLAFMREAQVRSVVGEMSRGESGPLLRDLRVIRERGYALTRNERVSGALSISAPIFSHNENVIAGLTISGPVERFTDKIIEKDVYLVTRAAGEISAKMGRGNPHLRAGITV